MAKDKQEFLQFLADSNEKFVNAYNTRQYSGVQEIFAPDAHLMPPNHHMFAPKDIPDFIKLIVSRGHHSLSLQTQEVFGPFGDIAIERSIVEFYTAEKKKKYNIKALIFWKKLNGKWKIQCDCWNFDHPDAMA